MQVNSKSSALILGLFIFLGLSMLGYLIGKSAIEFKQLERTIKVKGLSEREFPADVVIWPIEFTVANNKLEQLYLSIESNNASIKAYLSEQGIDQQEITFSTPRITDKTADQYGGSGVPEFRFSAQQIVTVYSSNISAVRSVMGGMSELGKKGIVFTNNNYESRTQYLFTRLNEVKPEMIEEATRNAREVANKFASDSQSKLGKIKRATQGQFSINARDTNNPHIKKLRVVSTIEYYLSD